LSSGIGKRPLLLRAAGPFLILAVLLVASLPWTEPARAATTWVVTGTGDSGGSCAGSNCTTLRAALAAVASGDTITFNIEHQRDAHRAHQPVKRLG
jgi:hypothetical protein